MQVCKYSSMQMKKSIQVFKYANEKKLKVVI